jgi:hypothetical protein
MSLLTAGWRVRLPYGLISYIETKATCRYLKKLTCKGTLTAGVYLSEAPPRPMSMSAPPLHTGYVNTCIRTVYLFTQGGGGGR